MRKISLRKISLRKISLLRSSINGVKNQALKGETVMKKRTPLALICVVMASLVLVVAAQSNPNRSGSAPELEGTWRVRVTPSGPVPPSQAFHTYTSGGGLIQSNLSEGPFPGHGTWVKTGRHEYTLTFEKFLADNPITPTPGDPAVFKVQETIEVDQDTYTGVGAGYICNLDGTGCIPLGCANTSATRIRAEAPPCR